MAASMWVKEVTPSLIDIDGIFLCRKWHALEVARQKQYLLHEFLPLPLVLKFGRLMVDMSTNQPH